MKKTALLPLLAIPVTLILGSRLPGRWYYLTSTLVIVETMLPFFMLFEHRRPQARELVTIAVMCALAVASRVAFAIPFFKPITGVIMIAGIALGPEAGFMVGAISAFASNFFYSQGPWTPWQMMAYGFGGFLAGALFHKPGRTRNPIVLAVFGYLTIQFCVGPLLDCSSVFTGLSVLTWEGVLLTFAQGLWVNFTHGLACALTLLLFSRPMLRKLERLKMKYGMLTK